MLEHTLIVQFLKKIKRVKVEKMAEFDIVYEQMPP